MAEKSIVLSVAGHEVTITNPQKVFFPQAGHTKLDLAKYYLAVAEGAIRGVNGRPMALKRYVHGADKPFFFQKRAPENRPVWTETVTLSFPSGRTADEMVIRNAAQLMWIVNLGCIDLNPHPTRAEDLDHPDELRIDLDPVPGVAWGTIRDVAMCAKEVLEEHGLVAWPKTSGSRGIHVYARLERKWGFTEVRKAALAVAREVERRMPGRATSKWWKEEREGVFLDYNQNAKDRTVASAYSVRPTADARVSAPLRWEEVPGVDAARFTLATMAARFAEVGDPSKGIDEAAGSLEKLLALSARQSEAGMGDAPWPPHYAKQDGEPPRVQPSRAKKAAPESSSNGRRVMKRPVITIARSASKEDALAGLERWKVRHPGPAGKLAEKDVLVDAMRGRYTTWTRIRINLENVPAEERPAEEAADPDFDPTKAR
jgi:DNA ligase D-like protein (predicted polymerase)